MRQKQKAIAQLELYTHLATVLPRFFRAMWLILKGLSEV